VVPPPLAHRVALDKELAIRAVADAPAAEAAHGEAERGRLRRRGGANARLLGLEDVRVLLGAGLAAEEDARASGRGAARLCRAGRRAELLDLDEYILERLAARADVDGRDGGQEWVRGHPDSAKMRAWRVERSRRGRKQRTQAALGDLLRRSKSLGCGVL
jgi:hypothetical protein